MVGWVTLPFFSFCFLKASVLCTCISMCMYNICCSIACTCTCIVIFVFLLAPAEDASESERWQQLLVCTCAVLLCLVCLFDLACFFLSFKNMYMYMYITKPCMSHMYIHVQYMLLFFVHRKKLRK